MSEVPLYCSFSSFFSSCKSAFAPSLSVCFCSIFLSLLSLHLSQSAFAPSLSVCFFWNFEFAFALSLLASFVCFSSSFSCLPDCFLPILFVSLARSLLLAARVSSYVSHCPCVTLFFFGPCVPAFYLTVLVSLSCLGLDVAVFVGWSLMDALRWMTFVLVSLSSSHCLCDLQVKPWATPPQFPIPSWELISA